MPQAERFSLDDVKSALTRVGQWVGEGEDLDSAVDDAVEWIRKENARSQDSAAQVVASLFDRLEGEEVELVDEDGTSSRGVLARRPDGGADVGAASLRPPGEVDATELGQLVDDGWHLVMRYADGGQAELRWLSRPVPFRVSLRCLDQDGPHADLLPEAFRLPWSIATGAAHEEYVRLIRTRQLRLGELAAVLLRASEGEELEQGELDSARTRAAGATRALVLGVERMLHELHEEGQLDSASEIGSQRAQMRRFLEADGLLSGPFTDTGLLGDHIPELP